MTALIGFSYSSGKGATLGLGFGGGVCKPPKLMPVIMLPRHLPIT
jgi:hypothetical protein